MSPIAQARNKSTDPTSSIDKPRNKEIRNQLISLTPEITKALPQANLEIDRQIKAVSIIRTAITLINESPKLEECSSTSLMGGILRIATLGLELSPEIAQCYLIPFKGHAKVIIGYKGLIVLAMRTGLVNRIWGDLVYTEDHFEILSGSEERKLIHRPKLVPPSQRGQILGAYAVVEKTNGSHVWKFLWDEEIQEIRKNAYGSTSKESPWNTHYKSMAMKTAIRSLLTKDIPLSVDLQEGVFDREDFQSKPVEQVETLDVNGVNGFATVDNNSGQIIPKSEDNGAEK